MNRKDFILILLFLSWPVNNLVRFFSWPVMENYRPFLFVDEVVHIEWYIWHISGSVCYVMIFWAMWLYINASYRKDWGIITMFSAVFINQFSDVFHYIGWQRHSEKILFLQGAVLVFAGAVILIDRYLKSRHGASR